MSNRLLIANNLLMSKQSLIDDNNPKQECIPVGYVPPALPPWGGLPDSDPPRPPNRPHLDRDPRPPP